MITMIASFHMIAAIADLFFLSDHSDCSDCRVIFIILFTGLLCDNWNFLMYEPRKGQSPTLSCANCVILHLVLAFHSNNSNLNV